MKEGSTAGMYAYALAQAGAIPLLVPGRSVERAGKEETEGVLHFCLDNAHAERVGGASVCGTAP